MQGHLKIMGAIKANADDEPHPLDVALGQSVRLRRRALRMSQQALADAIGVSFQQVQKYERGTNRVSFSRLVEIGHTLGCRVSDLVDDLDEDKGRSSERIADLSKLRLPGAVELLDAYSAISSPRLRRSVLELAQSMMANAPATMADD